MNFAEAVPKVVEHEHIWSYLHMWACVKGRLSSHTCFRIQTHIYIILYIICMQRYCSLMLLSTQCVWEAPENPGYPVNVLRCCMDGHGTFGQLVATMAVQLLPCASIYEFKKSVLGISCKDAMLITCSLQGSRFIRMSWQRGMIKVLVADWLISASLL